MMYLEVTLNLFPLLTENIVSIGFLRKESLHCCIAPGMHFRNSLKALNL